MYQRNRLLGNLKIPHPIFFLQTPTLGMRGRSTNSCRLFTNGQNRKFHNDFTQYGMNVKELSKKLEKDKLRNNKNTIGWKTQIRGHPSYLLQNEFFTFQRGAKLFGSSMNRVSRMFAVRFGAFVTSQTADMYEYCTVPQRN